MIGPRRLWSNESVDSFGDGPTRLLTARGQAGGPSNGATDSSGGSPTNQVELSPLCLARGQEWSTR